MPMGKVQRSGRPHHQLGEEEEQVEVEVEKARWAVERASERVEKGDLEGALWLLERTERMHPSTHGLAEIQAVAQVCHAATWNPCACSASQHTSPQWYRILMVSEKADLSAIKKRYRQLALLLHPDKNKHARAEEAFKLVSEAYAHLSDNKKRDAFDSSIRKRECRKCLFESHPCWESTKCSRESLKGKNQTDFQSRFFPFEFHTTEWRMEHEKLRMFRERAQAKVDSLAQILKEQRSRWTEEMGTTKGRCKKASDYSMNKRYYQSDVLNQRQQGVEERMLNSRSFEELHRLGRAKNGELNKLGGSFLNTDKKKPSQILKDGVEETLLEELKSRTSREKQTPRVLQNLNGLLGILKEGMGGSASVKGEDAKLRDGNNQCEEDRVEGNADTCQGHTFWVKRSSVQCGNNLEEEFTVIDDFLAGLNECVQQNQQPLSGYTDRNFIRADETYSLNGTSMKKIGRESFLFAKNSEIHDAESCNESLQEPTTALFKERFAQKSLERKKSMACFQADYVALKPIFSHDKVGIGVLKGNRSRKKSKLPMNDSVQWNITCGTIADEENILQSQKKKSEQLLRTLERLREETKSVAATLESMKEARLFPAGSCHVPVPAASIIAT